MASLPIAVLIAIFVVAAGAVWIAGTHLSRSTDVLCARFGIGEALGGLILLAVATNLPEIAITVSASLSHDLGIAVGNSSAASRSRPSCWCCSTRCAPIRRR